MLGVGVMKGIWLCKVWREFWVVVGRLIYFLGVGGEVWCC